MAKEKDNRRILSGVQLDDGGEYRTFGPGDEDELEDVIGPKMLERMLEEGALDGDWKAGGKDPEVPDNKKGRIAMAEKRRERKAKAEAARKADAEKAAKGHAHVEPYKPAGSSK